MKTQNVDKHDQYIGYNAVLRKTLQYMEMKMQN